MNDDSTDFYRPIERVRTYKANDVENRERGIRLFCTQSGSMTGNPKHWHWTLQVRSPMTLGTSGYGKEGRDFVIAGAPLGLDDMRALRDAITAMLKEAGAIDG